MLLSRELYKKIKSMNRHDMEVYLSNLFNEGQNEGIKKMSKELSDRIDRGIRKTEGIGEKRYTALINNIAEELSGGTE